jgi:hypothetical protein
MRLAQDIGSGITDILKYLPLDAGGLATLLEVGEETLDALVCVEYSHFIALLLIDACP